MLNARFVVLILLVVCAPATGAARVRRAKPARAVFFDDFNYTTRDAMRRRGWIVRAKAGWPGVPGATWAPEGVTFVDDPATAGNRVMRMTSSTDGSAANTKQTQICQQRKYLEGTYAARVRFTDAPASGPSGDQLVESFYTISPLVAPMDPSYSELDFEYLPNGGWGVSGSTLYSTTWETYRPEPDWQKDNVFKLESGSVAGWHTLVTQVGGGKVRYYVDGRLFAEHGGEYYPESLMSINFNLWFIRDGATKSTEVRVYTEEVDWVYHEAGVVRAPEAIEADVRAMRRRGLHFRDTVPAPVPALVSPCDT